MDKVQFIHELALAKLELESLSAEFEPTNSMRKFCRSKKKCGMSPRQPGKGKGNRSERIRFRSKFYPGEI